MTQGLRVAILTMVLLGRSALLHAEPDTTEEFAPAPKVEDLWNGGAIPFIYAAAGITFGLHYFANPPESPRFFSESEGGEEVLGDTVPEAAVAAFAIGSAGLIAAVPTGERWHHLKGFAEGIFTTLAITEIAKNVVGRHRPSFSESQKEDIDLRRSFFSGHSSLTAASTVYFGLYLNLHILPSVMDSHLRLAQAAATVGLGGILIGVPATRVKDNRHHLSDVVTGVAVGSATAVGFYLYQSYRFSSAKQSHNAPKSHKLTILPDLKNRGVVLSGRW